MSHDGLLKGERKNVMEIFEKGKYKIKSAGYLIIGASLLALVLHIFQYREKGIVLELVRMVITLGAISWMVKGSKIARGVMIVLLGVTIISLVLSLYVYIAYPVTIIALVLIILFYVGLEYCVIMDKSVNYFYNHYQEYRYESRYKS